MQLQAQRSRPPEASAPARSLQPSIAYRTANSRCYRQIIQRDRAGAVALDDPVGVLNQLPTALDQHGSYQTGLPGPARQQQPGPRIKQETMDEVRESVPVSDVLRIFRALYHTMPEFDVTACADRQPAHRIQNRCLQRQQSGGHGDPMPG